MCLTGSRYGSLLDRYDEVRVVGMKFISYILSYMMGVEDTVISVSHFPDAKTIIEIENELSNGTYDFRIVLKEEHLLIRWSLHSTFLKLWLFAVTGFFLIFLGCGALGVLILVPHYILMGFLGVLMALFLNRWATFIFRPWVWVIKRNILLNNNMENNVTSKK